ncbi:APC family permease [Sulfobacillus sp. DSM 109850]|uniref:APC family permease n=1 Tax=Sulfobacillus harzensis TaxID=2729629 RepID=A0A7Y0L8W7_9FIRM|nr:APC family permease [Sulfobacillus harzensis]
MAPTAAMALNGSLAASIAGTAVPLAFLGALITIALVSYSFIEFSRTYAHAGSVYAFNGRGLGARFGFLSGWVILLTYVAFTGASMAEVGAFFQTFLAFLGIQIPWIIPAVVAGALFWYLSFRDVRLPTRVTMVFEGVSIIIILILTAVILAKGGAHGLSLKPFVVGSKGISAVGLASVFAFLSFAGFEGAATLGEETANPKRSIPRAIMMAVFLTGAFYLLISYTQSEGFGLGSAGVHAFSASTAPLATLAKTYVGRAMAAIIMFGANISAFSSALVTATAGARILFAMSRDGFGPKKLGQSPSAFSIAISFLGRGHGGGVHSGIGPRGTIGDERVWLVRHHRCIGAAPGLPLYPGCRHEAIRENWAMAGLAVCHSGSCGDSLSLYVVVQHLPCSRGPRQLFSVSCASLGGDWRGHCYKVAPSGLAARGNAHA